MWFRDRIFTGLRTHPVVGLNEVDGALFRCALTLRNGMALALKGVNQSELPP